MNTTLRTPQPPNQKCVTSIHREVDKIINDLIVSLPEPDKLSSARRRGIIARYTAILEGNFIYWMTAAYLSARSKDSLLILTENLREEVQDSHPLMLRRFALAANAFPTDTDALALNDDLTRVRLFLGRMSGVRIILMMAFFEGFIQRFMIFLADLAARQGSAEQEYTAVHGVCDVAHTQELFRALSTEMTVSPLESSSELFEGVDLLRELIVKIIQTN